MSAVCPNCTYERQESDRGAAGECPRCGVVYEKWRPRVDAPALEPTAPGSPPFEYEYDDYDDDEEIGPRGSLASRVLARFVTVKPAVSTFEFGGHAVLYALLFLWSWRFILMDYRGAEINGSFLHNVNLVFHEAGHVLFRPFGDFMTVLGGSLGQLLVPLVVAVAFLVKNRDPFGASVGVWWLGQSFKDLAPYIYDASRLVMPLLGGVTGADVPGYHDWNNILRRLDILSYDHLVAKYSNRIGTALMLAFMVWGGYALYREYRNLDRDSLE
jgi:hypothetical protein